MKTKKLISLTAIALVVIASCKKAEQFETVPQNPAQGGGGGGSQLYNSIQDFFNQNGAPVQTFTLNSSTGGTFTGAGGSVFTFQPNSFVTASGGPVTGNVTVELRELLTKKDMIMSGVPPMSFGNALRTGGEFNLKVKQGSQTLELAPGMNYTAQLPVDSYLDSMDVYVGIDSLGSVDWVTDTSSTSYAYYNPAPSSFIMSCGTLNWINCDGPYWPSIATPISVDAPGYNLDFSNSLVLAVVTNDKVVCQLYPSWVTGDFEWLYAPQGYAGTIVVIYVDPVTKKLYSSFTNLTFSTTTVTVNITETTEAALEAQLDLLD